MKNGKMLFPLPITGILILMAVTCCTQPQPATGIRLHSLFGDHMVLQRDKPIVIRGTAIPGGQVEALFAGNRKNARVDQEGEWEILFPPMQAGGPYSMEIYGTDTLRITDVMIGDVWVCSGQSNMKFALAGSENAVEEIRSADHPGIRLFPVALDASNHPEYDVSGFWVTCSPASIKDFSAVGYFFGREIHRNIQVPVGLIQSAWGATFAEAWTPRQYLEGIPVMAPLLAFWDSIASIHPDYEDRYDEYHRLYREKADELFREWFKANKLARETGTPPPPFRNPMMPGQKNETGVLFNAMIAPLTAFPVRGVIWYQGEGNASRAYQYRTLFPLLIRGWRDAWQDPGMPFYFVQLPNFGHPQKMPVEKGTWAELREAQFMTLRNLPNTGMAVCIDIGEADDAHPKNKQDVGKRLACWALAKSYGRNIIFSGPLYQSLEVQGPEAIISFSNVDGGLTTPRGEPLKGFAIAGKDSVFLWADAEIRGDKVILRHPSVTSPVAIRYGWADNPRCNLYNSDGLPASPFRTDDFPAVTRFKLKPR